MEFRKYQHVERFGTQETAGIENGRCYVFYKIDGTNASVWLSDGALKAGSRTRELTIESDNAGFCRDIQLNENVRQYLLQYPTHRLYGEWLVPHSLKTYRKDAWRRFYVFDVTIDKGEDDVEYLPYNVYKGLLEEFEIDYVPPIAICDNPTAYTLLELIEKTGQFLVEDGKGNGEGLVVKNYDYKNRYGRQTWAKIVSNEFKEKHTKTMGAPVVLSEQSVESVIVNEYVTEAFIRKEHAKIVNENDGWQTKFIPMLLNKVFHELVTEETWNILKEHKNPKIDFRILSNLTTQKVKTVMAELF